MAARGASAVLVPTVVAQAHGSRAVPQASPTAETSSAIAGQSGAEQVSGKPAKAPKAASALAKPPVKAVGGALQKQLVPAASSGIARSIAAAHQAHTLAAPTPQVQRPHGAENSRRDITPKTPHEPAVPAGHVIAAAAAAPTRSSVPVAVGDITESRSSAARALDSNTKKRKKRRSKKPVEHAVAARAPLHPPQQHPTAAALAMKPSQQGRVAPAGAAPGRQLSAFQAALRAKLQGGQFRFINERLYTQTGAESLEMMREDPSLFTAVSGVHTNRPSFLQTCTSHQCHHGEHCSPVIAMLHSPHFLASRTTAVSRWLRETSGVVATESA